MTDACAGRAASAARSTNPRVADVNGQASTNQSAWGSSPASSSYVAVWRASGTGVAEWRTTVSVRPSAPSKAPMRWPMAPQPTTTACWPARSRGVRAPNSGRHARARWSAASKGRRRAKANTPPMAVCATTASVAPCDVVMATPRACRC
ncbi:hypothetical protein D3C73_1021210 [compost metagenome]